MATLELRDVQVRFGAITAVDGLSLEVNAGEIVGLIGPNGAGKTVSFNVITGLQRPDLGQVLFEGRDITDLAPHKRTALGIGRTFQLVQLFGGMTVRENCMVAAHRFTHDGVVGGAVRFPQRGRALRAAAARADAALDFLGLGDLADVPVDGIPIGQARMVELARALCLQPKVLLLDEPASGLDPSETNDLAVTLAEIRSTIGCAMLLVEHDMSVVNGLCDHVYAMALGRPVTNGTPDEVRTDPNVRRSYLGDEAVDAAEAAEVRA